MAVEAENGTGAAPAGVGPLHRTHLDLGATMGLVDGWLQPLRYTPPPEEIRGAGLCDLSALQKWDLKGAGLAAVPVVGNLGIGRVARVSPGGGLCCRLADDHALVTAGPCGDTPPDLTPEGCAHATELTWALSAFALAGPHTASLLARLTPLDLRGFPDRSCAQTTVARCHAVLARLDERDLPAYRLFVTRDLALFVWEALVEAGTEFGLTPIGIQAWRELSGPGESL